MSQPTELDPSRFYISSDPQISPQTKAILTQYSGIPSNEIIPHIRRIRDKGWSTFKYPCIGLYNFLDFGIGTTPHYQEVLDRVKSGDTILDLGCCMGQDVRLLVFHGAPAENITASDLEPEFIDLGFDLFLDRDKLAAKTTWTSGDFFAPARADLKAASFDIINASSFFHLFSWEVQVEAYSLVLKLLKPKAGSMIIGRQTGVQEPGVVGFKTSRSDEMFRHNAASLKELIESVGEKEGVKLGVEVEQFIKPGKKEEERWMGLNYSIVLQ